MKGYTTWRKELSETLKYNNQTWDDVEACTLTPAQLDTEFCPGHCGEEGEAFTVWTAKVVYFPACYDGSEWVAGVSRNPDYGRPLSEQATDHIGFG